MVAVERSASIEVRRLGPEDLPAYKLLRDEALQRHPESFTSDAETERMRSPESYLGRLGLSEPLGGTFLMGAWVDGELAGSVACERELKRKLRHRANIVGMYVRESHTRLGIGRQLLAACVDLARQAQGLEMLTLTVTASNERAVRLYERAGFKMYGLLPRAIRVETGRKVQYFDKAHMVLML
ncbi:MAG: GNAT family N-acetyltransferase [Caldimonas sp.]|uniref:GNAT family N-acetyltransferase n=1 Tax=Caldimonas sp. TaxID=2838790 RepID=UPI00391D9FD2